MKLHEGIRHYGLEFLTVFLGVSLSLLAENWRQQRSDLTAEHNSLVQLYSDLGLENGDLNGNVSRAKLGLEASHWLLANGARGHATDSVSLAFTALGSCSFFVPYASEYTALKSSGRLSIIEEPLIRQDVVRFYEVEPFVQWLHERDCTLTGELMDSLLGKLEFAEPVRDTTRVRFGTRGSGARGAAQPNGPREPRPIPTWFTSRDNGRYPHIAFHTGQEALLDDATLRDRIVRLATQRQYLVDQIQGRLDLIQNLRTQIRTRLGSDTIAIREQRTRGGALAPNRTRRQ